MVKMSSPSEAELELLRTEAQANYRNLRERKPALDEDSIDVIIRGARSHYAWLDKPVPNALLEKIYDITAAGATSMNTCPARFTFVTSAEGKDRLAKALKDKNIDKMKSAPVTAIISYDLSFWEDLPYLFPHEDRRGFFKGKDAYIETTAFRNSTLQGAYARAVGLDVGAMSGFSNEIVDEEFFKDSSQKSNFLCNIGYADESALFQKLPRFSFDQACSYL